MSTDSQEKSTEEFGNSTVMETVVPPLEILSEAEVSDLSQDLPFGSKSNESNESLSSGSMTSEVLPSRFIKPENPSESAKPVVEKIEASHAKDPLESAKLCLAIMQRELLRLQEQAEMKTLDGSEAKLLQSYLTTFVNLHQSGLWEVLNGEKPPAKSESSEPDLSLTSKSELAALGVAALKELGYGVDLEKGVLTLPKENEDG